MKYFSLLSIILILSACGSHFSDKGGYNIAGSGLVPEKKQCYDTVYTADLNDTVVTEFTIDTVKCRTGDYNWNW